MGSDAVPQEFRDKLRWLPDPPDHVPIVRRAMQLLVRLGRVFEFKGDERVEAALFVAEGGIHSFYTVLPEADTSVAFWSAMFEFTRRVLAEPR